MNLPTLWRRMLAADQEYLDARERWRKVAGDETIPWDGMAVADATNDLTDAGVASTEAHAAFDEALARVNMEANLRSAA